MTVLVFMWSYHEWIGLRPDPIEGHEAQEDKDAAVEIPVALYERFVSWEKEFESIQAELKKLSDD